MKLIQFLVISREELALLAKIFDYHNRGLIYYKDFIMKVKNPRSKLG